MNHFTQLYLQLDQTTKTNEKVAALKQFFLQAPASDQLWALALFTHKAGRKRVSSKLLKQWVMAITNLEPWLFEESYHLVGDLAEVISLLVPAGEASAGESSLTGWMELLRHVASLPDEEKMEKVSTVWKQLSRQEILVFNKLLTGGFRIGVSQNLIIRGLSEAYRLEPTQVAHRLMGTWHPESVEFSRFILDPTPEDDFSRPYPFFLAYPLEKNLMEEQPPHLWQAEWKWDGIRCQLIHRGGSFFVWSRGEELMTDKFPELAELAEKLPDGVVIDGELLPFRDGKPLDFALLQTRIGRKNLTTRQLREVPVSIYAYDLLEYGGQDIRDKTLESRRNWLEMVCRETHSEKLLLSPSIKFATWADLQALHAKSRENMAEGFMLKRIASTYQVGRKRGDWWKWKVDPMQIDAVLVYAQKGHGRRADLFTDYTFAVWDGDKLVTFAKAYSGLTDQEIRLVDAFVKRNTFEKFGPVRTVKPELVFEIGFEGIQASARHKSGIAVRFPRILRWRTDKTASEANSLADLRGLLAATP